jgi:hypothetical protein
VFIHCDSTAWTNSGKQVGADRGTLVALQDCQKDKDRQCNEETRDGTAGDAVAGAQKETPHP